MGDGGSVAVLGSHGFIGNALVRRLLATGTTRIAAVDRLADQRPTMLPDDERIVPVTEDVRFLDLAHIGSPELVYYLCAAPFVPDSFSDPAGTEEANVEVLQDFLKRNSRTAPPRIVYVSSGEVYGNVPSGCADERKQLAEPEKLSPYGRSRVLAERLLADLGGEFGSASVVVRLFNVIGPRATQAYFVPEMIRQIVKNDVVRHGNLDAIRDFVWIEDAVRGLAAAHRLCGTTSTAVNVATGTAWPMADVLTRLLSISDRAGMRTELDRDRLRPVELPRLVGCPDRLETTLGWRREVHLDEALRRTLAWYREAGSWPYESGLR